MINKNIIHGTQFTWDKEGLAMIGKTKKGISLSYKQGGSFEIEISDEQDRNRQYSEMTSMWKEKESSN